MPEHKRSTFSLSEEQEKTVEGLFGNLLGGTPKERAESRKFIESNTSSLLNELDEVAKPAKKFAWKLFFIWAVVGTFGTIGSIAGLAATVFVLIKVAQLALGS